MSNFVGIAAREIWRLIDERDESPLSNVEIRVSAILRDVGNVQWRIAGDQRCGLLVGVDRMGPCVAGRDLQTMLHAAIQLDYSRVVEGFCGSAQFDNLLEVLVGPLRIAAGIKRNEKL